MKIRNVTDCRQRYVNQDFLLDAIAALRAIEMRASCAPNDDPEIAGREFTRIMLQARAAIATAQRGVAP